METKLDCKLEKENLGEQIEFTSNLVLEYITKYKAGGAGVIAYLLQQAILTNPKLEATLNNLTLPFTARLDMATIFHSVGHLILYAEVIASKDQPIS